MSLVDTVRGIRYATKADIGALARIETTTGGEWTAPEFEAMLGRRLRHVFVVAVQTRLKSGNGLNRVGGYAVVDYAPVSIRIVGLAVRRAWWRRGYGTALVRHIEERARMHDRRVIRVTVCDDQLGAHLFLRSCGFLALRVRRDPTGKGPDAYEFKMDVEGDHQ